MLINGQRAEKWQPMQSSDADGRFIFFLISQA